MHISILMLIYSQYHLISSASTCKSHYSSVKTLTRVGSASDLSGAIKMHDYDYDVNYCAKAYMTFLHSGTIACFILLLCVVPDNHIIEFTDKALAFRWKLEVWKSSIKWSVLYWFYRNTAINKLVGVLLTNLISPIRRARRLSFGEHLRRPAC